MALVHNDGGSDFVDQFCGGTLIAPQWVLTAAHCVEPALTPAQLDVVAGTNRLDDSGTRVHVAEIRVHPQRDIPAKAFDLALLKLATPLTLSALPITTPGLSGLWAPGRTAQVAGWGNTSASGMSFPVDLMEAAVPLVSDAYCDARYTPTYSAPVMLCAGDVTNGGVDTCQGDSGGPLVVADAAGHPVLAGDTSFGNGCAQPGDPGVYGEIAGMRAFVDATLGWSTAASATPASLSFDAGATGPQGVTLTSTGSAPLSVASATLSGAGAGQFAIAADDCSQTVLQAGQGCSVSVGATPTGGDADAQLVLAGDGAAGSVAVALTRRAPAPAPSPAPVAAAATASAPPRRAAKAPTATLRALPPLRGRHRLAATLSGAGTITVTVTRRVRRHGRLVTQKLATATATLPAAGTRTLTLKLTAAGRRAFRHGHRVRATLTIVTRAGTAHATTRRTLKLR